MKNEEPSPTELLVSCSDTIDPIITFEFYTVNMLQVLVILVS